MARGKKVNCSFYQRRISRFRSSTGSTVEVTRGGNLKIAKKMKMTKPTANQARASLKTLQIALAAGRVLRRSPRMAPALLNLSLETRGTGLTAGRKIDYWENTPSAWVRHHVVPRANLFTPVGTNDGPMIGDFAQKRTTAFTFIDRTPSSGNCDG